jgi:hypothetical protein
MSVQGDPLVRNDVIDWPELYLHRILDVLTEEDYLLSDFGCTGSAINCEAD